METIALFVMIGPIVFFVAVIFGLSMVLLLSNGWKYPALLLPSSFYPMLLLFACTSVMYITGLSGDGPDSRHWSIAWANRFTSLFLMLAAVIRIIHHYSHPRQLKENQNLLLIAFTVYWITNVLSPMVFGTYRLTSHEYVYSLALGSAAILATSQEGEKMIRAYRDGMFAFLVLGLLILVLQPAWVLSSLESSFIPGMKRYAGLAIHPNSLGALTLTFLLCLWNKPYHHKMVSRLAWGIGLLSLLLAESKTTIIGFTLISIVTWWVRNGTDFKKILHSQQQSYLFAIILSALLLCITAAVLGLMFSDRLDRISLWLRSSSAMSTITLTGRDVIWIEALNEWHRNPLFGYGLSMWDEAFRAKVNEAAYHAHNQLLQSMSIAGIVGAVGLIGYVLVLGITVFKSARASEGLTLGILILLLIRSITEVPFTLKGYGTELVMHLLLLAVIASHLPKRENLPVSKANRIQTPVEASP